MNPPSKGTSLKELTFCALDFETTGVNPVFDRIIEIGMIKFTLKEVLDSYETLIDPQIPIPLQAQRIHGISDNMVNKSPLIEEVKGDLIDFLDNAIFVIQNPAFDLSFVEMFIHNDKEAKSVHLHSIDTVTLARKTWPHFHNHKLGTLSTNLDIDHTCHRALSDTEVCMKVFIEVLKEKDAMEWTWKDFLSYHGDLLLPGLSRKSDGILFRGVEKGDDVTIKYEDSSGIKTVRKITAIEVIRYGKKSYVSAYCHLRKGIRYFAAERITEIISND
jgi:DNA polymerase III epsilon subunit family exonuclease